MVSNEILTGALCAAALLAANELNAADNVAYQDTNARFTVVTDGVVRMEWQPDGRFVDNMSQIAVERDYPACDYHVDSSDSLVTITTDKMQLRYRPGSGPFSADNLAITSGSGLPGNFEWRPGMKQTANLKGTTRTLDGLDGDVQTQTWCTDMNQGDIRVLDDGLLARDGWTLINDSGSYLFDDDPEWPWVADRPEGGQDWYFMAYGNDYKKALRDFTVFAGRMPLPPRFAFGYWWSRYWAYSDSELRHLVDKFAAYDIPLDVLVVDMDWHYTDPGRGGWTGWTWNESLFPDPAGFMSHLHDKGVKVTLNLHPAEGFEPYEAAYPALAAALGKTDGSKIDWVNSDKPTIRAVFDTVLRPMERDGVDFWWLDWQQYLNDPVKTGLDNTWWINYCFFHDMEHNRPERALLYHRWGGLGNHRYQVGFSGDAVISWKSLDYQPYFTSTASNVLYGYWSHDLGGHLDTGNGIDPEMYTRWLQFGGYSPIMRTHSSKASTLNKEPWVFADEYRDVIRRAILDRYRLVPYIYTMARNAHDEGLSICRPMYYDHPDADEAYSFDRQYMFGDDMLIAPVTSPAGEGGYATVDVWLPEGDWYEVHTGTRLNGGKVHRRHFAIDEYGVYVRAGSIVPMYGADVRRLNNNDEPIELNIYPGSEGSLSLYEDAGNDNNYRTEFARTPVDMSSRDGVYDIHIGPREGSYAGMPAERRFGLRINCAYPPESVTVDGKPAGWTYDGDALAIVVDLGVRDCARPTDVKVMTRADNSSLADGLAGRIRRVGKAIEYIKFNGCDTHADELASMGTTSQRIGYNPAGIDKAVAEFNRLYEDLPEVLSRQGMDADAAGRFLQRAVP